MPIALIVHGGASEVPPEEQPAYERGCLAAAEAGWAVLRNGGAALDAVIAAIRIMEDDPTFNAGCGSVLNADGRVQMDAGLMEGTESLAGGVGAIEGVRNPILVARKVLDSMPAMVVGADARRFAAERGIPLCDPDEMITPKQRQKWEKAKQQSSASKKMDTVGCVAMDSQGRIAAGASTGGLSMKVPGRVGDSPQIGCGIYAENGLGGCSVTGDGDAIARVVFAKTACDLIRPDRAAEEAARQAVDYFQSRVAGEAGCILIDGAGRTGWAHNSAHMPVAYLREDVDAPRYFIAKREEREAA
jgi:beta-aspartyl-peptidase (threonine type)